MNESGLVVAAKAEICLKAIVTVGTGIRDCVNNTGFEKFIDGFCEKIDQRLEQLNTREELSMFTHFLQACRNQCIEAKSLVRESTTACEAEVHTSVCLQVIALAVGILNHMDELSY